jgi:hypothetical protein
MGRSALETKPCLLFANGTLDEKERMGKEKNNQRRRKY